MLNIMPLNNNNNSLLKFSLVGLSLSLSGLFAGMFFLSTNTNAFAQQQLQTLNPTQNITTTNDATNTLSLTGTATTTVKPDKVTVSLGVETTNKTADAALAANSKIMNQVIGALKADGVKDNETSTSSFSILPNYNYSQPSSTASRITGFTVSNLIQIQSTIINNTSKWIDTAIAAGANTVDRIDFALSDKKLEETKTNLIKQAMQDAKAKANTVASAASVKVVGIRSINLNELAIQSPTPIPIPLANKSLAATEARPTPIISGQEEVTANIAVTFLIQ
jgi:uncharacterized protein